MSNDSAQIGPNISGNNHPENIANAHFIAAAAPDLLAALRGLACEMESVCPSAPGLIHAFAAIAKAEGRSHRTHTSTSEPKGTRARVL